MKQNTSPETICIQGGWKPKNGEPRILPIYQSTTFKYETSDRWDVCLIWKKADIFTADWQIRQPTQWHQKSVNWKVVWQPMPTSSGQAGNLYSIINICCAGDHVVSSATIYGHFQFVYRDIKAVRN